MARLEWIRWKFPIFVTDKIHPPLALSYVVKQMLVFVIVRSTNKITLSHLNPYYASKLQTTDHEHTNICCEYFEASNSCVCK